LAADVAGYSRLIGADEGGTLTRLKAIRTELIDPAIAANNGRLVKTTGDGLLVEFSGVVDALCYATAVQAGMADRNATTPADKRIDFRIGINMGRRGRARRSLQAEQRRSFFEHRPLEGREMLGGASSPASWMHSDKLMQGTAEWQRS
jgi:hypothetical protein